MADWKQITARIRRARTGKDPAGQLSNLFQKTQDAMVAFELARFLENSGQSGEAAKWYATAAERFRRRDWKSKAQEAATRLSSGVAVEAVAAESVALEGAAPGEAPATLPLPIPEPGQPFEETAIEFQSAVAAGTESAPAAAPAVDATNRSPRSAQNRPRGRRGGRHRRGAREAGGRAASSPSHAVPPAQAPPPVDETGDVRFSRVAESSSHRPVVEAAVEPAPSSPRARYGDPGVSSRLTLLEMQFRRLLNCPPMKLNDADRAPAGPGVFLLSDTELTTHYYVEACQTLRVAISGLARGSGSRRSGGESIKPRLAEHLGIPEARVTKYLADHCVVRYLQLDQDASNFAHFVIAVLRPALNE